MFLATQVCSHCITSVSKWCTHLDFRVSKCFSTKCKQVLKKNHRTANMNL